MASQMGSLKRTRNRGDSAYMSTASEIPSPGVVVEEEDTNGYVMPRVTHHPETGEVSFT